MYYLGIDVGMTGAIAIINDYLEVYLLEDCPKGEVAMSELIKVTGFKKSLGYRHTKIAIESAQSMPGNAARSMFKYGMNFGAWRMAFAMLELPVIPVSPQKWQNKMLVKTEGKDTKERSLVAARRLFPSQIKKLTSSKHGRSDALLIAYWLKEYGK